MDKISVVIPVFDAENTLRRCVESIVQGNNQENVEIILVEDCSKDSSWDLCLELQDEFAQVHAIRNSRNSGPSFTRNRGIEEASGNLLLFVDADDWVSCNYITSLYDQHREHEDALVLCGYKFIVDKTGKREDYCFSEKEIITSLDSSDRYFRLLDHILLQQLWNKIFDLGIIKKNKLYFDETQSMGEDTQFVIDYLRVASLKQCVIINKPLYYYIRTEQSLMGRNNKIDLYSSGQRLKELSIISDENDSIALAAYEKAIENNKSGLIYRIMHSDLPKIEKIKLIEKVCPKKNAKSIYCEYSKTLYKEKLSAELNKAKSLKRRLKNHINRIDQNRIINNAKNSLKRIGYTVISQNCIGGVFCHDMGIEFTSPTVNLFFKADDFVRFILNIEYYMSLPLSMAWEEEYPVAMLGDIKIFFMHYKTCKEAADSWERRKKRIDYSHIVVLCTDMEGFSPDTFREWKKIKYPKLLFTANKEYVNENSLFFPEFADNKQVPDLIPGRKFYKEGKLIKLINDLNW